MPTYATWNSADKSAFIALSNGDLTATSTLSATKLARSTVGLSSGKWYAEITVGTNVTNTYLGIATTNPGTNRYVGQDAESWGYRASDGTYYHSWSQYNPGSLVTYTTGDVIMIAIDLDNGKIWFGKNGTWNQSGDPGAGTGETYSGISGTIYLAATPYGNAGALTLNSGASAFTYSVPSGFESGFFEDDNITVDLSDYHALISVTPSASIGLSVPITAPIIEITPSISDVFFGITVDLSSYHALIEITPSAAIDTISIPITAPIISVTPAAAPRQIITLTSPVIEITTSCDVRTFVLQNPLIRFFCTLAGLADATTDIEIPISSFQARRRQGEPTYLAVVIPNITYSSQIAARSNGEIKIDMAFYMDGSEYQRQEIIRVDLETITIDEGSLSKSTTLSGHKTTTYSAKTVIITDVVYKRSSNGSLTFRCAKPNIFINPGDTIVYGDDSFTCSLISYTINAKQQYMEVSE